MSFTRNSFVVNKYYHPANGILKNEFLSRISDAEKVANNIIYEAGLKAEEILRKVNSESEEILANHEISYRDKINQIDERLKQLVQSANAQWSRVVVLLEPSVVAMANLAIRRVTADESLLRKIQMSAQLAISELPQNALQLHYSPSIDKEELSQHFPSVSLHPDSHNIASDTDVIVSSHSLSCHANFDDGVRKISNNLETWIMQSINCPLTTVLAQV